MKSRLIPNKILLTLVCSQCTCSIIAQTKEHYTTIEVDSELVLNLTDEQMAQLATYFADLQSEVDWAKYEYYSQENERLQQHPKVVFMGNSITQGWAEQHKEFFETNNYAGRGISGQTTYQMLARFQADVVDLHPKAVVILAGTNDIACNCGVISLENVAKNIKSMCELATANNIRPILCSVLPAAEFWWNDKIDNVSIKVMMLNKMIKMYADSNDIAFVDYYSSMVDGYGGLPKDLAEDGIHPNIKGYLIMESIIAPLLAQVENGL